ncbi:MAG: hypothetical protein VB024_07970 [Dysgonamonadaceae bacterium]|nr:hypothetical protein [Dysgonamonadaceae bacterium]
MKKRSRFIKMTSILIGTMFFVFLSLSCVDKEIVDDNSKPKPVEKDTENWVYRKNNLTGRGEKFFGIVHYNLPGYNYHRDPDPDGNNETIYKVKTTYCNTIIMDDKFVKPYMNDKILIINNYLRYKIQVYLSNQNLPEGSDKDYYGAQFLKENVNNVNFVYALDDAIDVLINKFKNFDMEYNTIDEIALGGLGNYFTPPAVGNKLYDRIKLKEGDPLVLVDLLGHGRGSTYFFEQNYLKEYGTMPKDPPYNILSDEARANKMIPLLGFSQAYDGTPVYNFDKNGNYTYNNIDFESYKKNWYENVKQIASAYRNSGNLFSLNAYNDFYKYPILSGITVDAIKAGVGDKPVWLYFDGNGYSKPASMSANEYVKIVKCQIYTSIIHGATGVLFWSDTSKAPYVFDALTPMLKELNENVDIFYMNTAETSIVNDLHIMIKENKGEKYIIASNTSKTKSVTINIPNVNKKSLAPLEVYVSGI